MIKALKNILIISLPTLLLSLLFLELFFRFIIPAAEAPTPYMDPEYQILRYNPDENTSGTFAYGKFSTHRFKWNINNEGWNAPYDYYPKTENRQLIAVIGDSYIDARQVNYDESYPYVL